MVGQFVREDDIIIYKLGQIESKLDQQAALLALNMSDAKVFNKDIEVRTRSLETSRAYNHGIAAVISLIATSALNFLYRIHT